MANPSLTIEFDVPPLLRQALKDVEFISGPARDFVRVLAFEIEGHGKQGAPVDTGRLRSSISTGFSDKGLTARVGSGVNYAPHVEFGTRPHWPPVDALQPWARRHGFPAGRRGAFLVARAIARRGTRARRFMQGAVATVSRTALPREMAELGRAIERRWGGLS